MKAEIEVLHPGLFSSIQDFGRRGFQKYGVPFSGTMDRLALKTANLILRNKADAAVLEITQMGPKLKFSAPAKIAISGAYLSPKLNDSEIENNEVIKIEPGDVLSFGRPLKGSRAYLAIAGGFQTEKILESRSWYEGITAFQKLEKGHRLPYSAVSGEVKETYASVKFDPSYLETSEIKVFHGPEFEKLPQELKTTLQKNNFSISKNNNRMAVQLGEKLENELEPIITGPVLPGTVQLTPGGNLIVLMRDCQTTGGYPRVLQLSEHSLNILAQKKTGEEVHFKLGS
ncbi:MAG: biotin-dependent carboxyltransferase family protein [Salegentibacter sp.]|uniref:5-oxoprolinase subunit C family protein n=1 Tax=Salegentibacter sp. TaxID=1903072 RepID=UPI0028703222|nr:biotin-dependent carboxyltransferase family protein [Salegentibacter sp.]MDR9457727.1 biotin-dependent carboxyltransferase family protein [Salegentibacter sp.]